MIPNKYCYSKLVDLWVIEMKGYSTFPKLQDWSLTIY